MPNSFIITIFLFIALVVLLITSHLLAKYLREKFKPQIMLIVSIGVCVLAIGLYIFDGIKNNISGIGFALCLIGFGYQKYKKDKQAENKQ